MTDSNRRIAHRRCQALAFCGTIAGLSITFMFISSAFVTDSLAAPLVAATLLMIVQLEFGTKAAWDTWIVAAAITLLLNPSKGSAIYYLFIGWWPIVKWSLDKWLKPIGIRFLVNVLILTIAITVMYGILYFIVGSHSAVALWTGIALFGTTLICMLIYDALLQLLSIKYTRRIQPKLSSLIHR